MLRIICNIHDEALMFTRDSVKASQKETKRVISLLYKTAYTSPPLKANILQVKQQGSPEIEYFSHFCASETAPTRRE